MYKLHLIKEFVSIHEPYNDCEVRAKAVSFPFSRKLFNADEKRSRKAATWRNEAAGRVFFLTMYMHAVQISTPNKARHIKAIPSIQTDRIDLKNSHHRHTGYYSQSRPTVGTQCEY